MAYATALAFLSSSVHAQEGSALEEDRPVPIYGTFETVEVDGRVISRQITENCEDEVVEHTGSSGGFGIVARGLLVAGLAAAAGGSGGDDGSSGGGNGGNTPSIPRLHPRRSPLLPSLGDWDNPASWRIEEFNSQYGLGLIGVEHRYAERATGENTLGAIYDTGIDLGHSDVGGVRLDLSHNYNGRPDDLSDPHGHGTVIYWIAGTSRNRFGIHGVAPDAQFIILKQAEIRLLNSFVDALRRVTDVGADVMNNSWVLRTRTGSFTPPCKEVAMQSTKNSSNGFGTSMKPIMIRYPLQLGKPWHGGCRKAMIEIPEVDPLDKLAADTSTALRIT